MMITAAEVVASFDYEPDTGWLRWKSPRRGIVVGERAGSPATLGYREVSYSRRRYKEHRLIWLHQTGHWPNEIDHINGVRDDNRWSNLRSVVRSDNQKNASRRSDNASGIVGVGWDGRRGAWRARISSLGRVMFLGHYESFLDAAAARKSAERQFGFHVNHGRTQ